ncbi:chemotaxis protein CheW [Qipengyuania aurantiaca]|uniref:Chemotaxis protein CheW n=1 Tax=Qipengyuania aurantiaca TaxID=2867233 RepID=A0ABX8ZMW1_9SPHN|nr:chemotaxis protein CheW [Qipengyuania aurantiaca]QZD90327.1 chemotaxis protein CheW [Qipengyuania aurantiaca]
MNELLLMCTIAGRRAAIPAIEVQSVIEVENITPIPGTPDFILGLTALRSQALTVIDCSLALGLEETAEHSERRAAVVEIEGHLYALLVEEAHDVGEARSEPVAVPGGFGEGWQRAARGMVETDGGPTLLVDIGQLISGPLREAA